MAVTSMFTNVSSAESKLLPDLVILHKDIIQSTLQNMPKITKCHSLIHYLSFLPFAFV